MKSALRSVAALAALFLATCASLPPMKGVLVYSHEGSRVKITYDGKEITSELELRRLELGEPEGFAK